HRALPARAGPPAVPSPPPPPRPMSHALLLEHVSKRYAGHTAVDDLSLAVPVGTIYGILGPNGAGKSTTIRMVMNILIRDAGSISLLGSDPERDREVLRRVGYLPEERGLYRKMKVLDVIVFFARLKGVDGGAARREGERWIERMGLGEWRGARVETLSKGMQQKVQFITTVVHDPDVLILDEPASGLDPVNQEVLRDTILDVRNRGKTVLFSTHNMAQAEELCEHVCIIAGGRKVLDGALRGIRRANRTRRYRVAFDVPSDEAARFLESDRRILRARRAGETWELELDPAADPREILAELNTFDAPLTRFELVEPTLHEIFVARVGDAATPHRRPEPAHV
ncbi:MAG TPA: ATP-binding cassette domain-containing protein, partial [Longimicrobiaceae bacterium]|nr:ATP-binding cassette domain-containing protein [Longimicrobiaceae bacterium]